MIELKKPKILGWNDKGDVNEIKRYLPSFVEEVQFAFNYLEDENTKLKEEIKKLKEAQS